MKVLGVTEKWSDREAGGETARRTLQVQLDAGGPGAEIIALLHPAIPREGDAHPFRDGLRAEAPSSRAVGPTFFEVTVPYRVPEGGSATEKAAAQQGPLAEPPEVRWTSAKSWVQRDFDIEGKPIANSAGVLFSAMGDPVQAEESDSILVIVRNEARYSEATAALYRDSVNSDMFWGAGPGRARCTDLTGEWVVREGVEFWRIMYLFQFRRDQPGAPAGSAWKEPRIDRGTHEKTNDKPPLRVLRDRNTGLPITDPVYFDGKGKPLAAGSKPIIFWFAIYPRRSFSALNLPGPASPKKARRA